MIKKAFVGDVDSRCVMKRKAVLADLHGMRKEKHLASHIRRNIGEVQSILCVESLAADSVLGHTESANAHAERPVDIMTMACCTNATARAMHEGKEAPDIGREVLE